MAKVLFQACEVVDLGICSAVMMNTGVASSVFCLHTLYSNFQLVLIEYLIKWPVQSLLLCQYFSRFHQFKASNAAWSLGGVSKRLSIVVEKGL